MASINFNEAMDKIEEAYHILKKGSFYMPPRPSIEYQNKTLLYMPCFTEQSLGTKILTVFPDNVKIKKPAIDGLMIIYNYETGEPLVVMDGKAVTAMRTGAVGGVGARYLSSKQSKSLGIIGAGTQGFYQALFACHARNIKEVYIYDYFIKDLSQFIHNLKSNLDHSDIEFFPCKDAGELVENSDIVITATTSNDPVLPNDKNLLEGKSFIGIGSYKPNMREYPDAIWSLVDHVYIDLEFACEESGDLSQPISKGILSKDRIKNFTELLESESHDMEQNNKTTFFKSVGMALFDLCIAEGIYVNAMKKNIGQRINF